LRHSHSLFVLISEGYGALPTLLNNPIFLYFLRFKLLIFGEPRSGAAFAAAFDSG